MIHKCINCSTDLVVGENITQYRIDVSWYICRTCINAYNTKRNHQTGQSQPMSENRACPAFLGVHVAERMLSRIFKNVCPMPYGNPGYDFRCGKGYLVDGKSACRQHQHKSDRWMFCINKNQIADYFLMLAFDNRESLNPEHIWLIPADNINDKVSASISETTLDKWNEFEQPIDRVVACCDTMQGTL